MKWKAYWTALAAGLFGLALVRNWRKYPQKSKRWVAGKAALDTTLVGLLAWLCPPLLIAYSVLWIIQLVKTNSPVLKVTIGTLAGISLGALGGWLLEAVLIVGVWAIDLVTGPDSKWWGRFCRHYRDLKGQTA